MKIFKLLQAHYNIWNTIYCSINYMWCFRMHQNWRMNSRGKKCWFRNILPRSIIGSRCWKTSTSSIRSPQNCRKVHWPSWNRPQPTFLHPWNQTEACAEIQNTIQTVFQGTLSLSAPSNLYNKPLLGTLLVRFLSCYEHPWCFKRC